MAEKLKIKITIANRVYPLSIQNANEEQGMRRAAKKISELVKKFEKNYAVSDKQDVLAMCALQFASLLEIKAIEKEDENVLVSEKIDNINKLLERTLKDDL
ncbi:MAG: cell division protein ZapA [Flavobacteriaceae bacterium]|nr:cell division protein ZapA [Flavobacteriaceae bacterium]